MDNSTLLVPTEGERSDYAAYHARWDHSLPSFLWRQFTKKYLATSMKANLDANRVGSMPALYRLA
ncbi:MAG: hypothetical protein M3Y91_04675 [Actinomycetota bacterium]|nr:hypothetical protein [Actinomycetota bacterium]